MISISRLLCDTVSPGDKLRYHDGPNGKDSGKDNLADIPRPVVVWNCTRQCNLSCIHCYASASNRTDPGQMNTGEAKKFIEYLADYGVPVLLFSGGEPLLREDIFELAEFAINRGIRVALSTNGTLISKQIADTIKDIGFAEVGVSLDGIGANHDKFRGKVGAFEKAMQGIRHCLSAKTRLSLRLTITGHNYNEIPSIFHLVEEEGIDRVCFYHLAYSGRGGDLVKQDVTHEQTRWAVDTICENTLDMHRRGLHKEILTVGNHSDGIYLYLKTVDSDPKRAAKIFDLLKLNGGNNSGIRIGAVDDSGNVHADQFWQHYSLGNVKTRKFGDIWSDGTEPLLQKLRDRKKFLKGRCGICKYVDLCNGNLRVRAEAFFNDVWAEDPACYLTDAEIGL